MPTCKYQISSASDNIQKSKLNSLRRQLKESKFKKGIVEEVSRDDKGYKGVWFLDTVVDIIGKDRFQVEYRDLKTNEWCYKYRKI